MVGFMCMGIIFIGNTTLFLMFMAQGRWDMAAMSLIASAITGWGVMKTLQVPDPDLPEDEETAAA
ncbi:MAG: hypothetical protein DI585_00895 [Pseudomonas fluorescens]|nr:MAG: hypothetical protein DI585_00895 [Pseudomonas fluorescens]